MSGLVHTVIGFCCIVISMADNNKVIITYRYSTYSSDSYDARRDYSDGHTIYTGQRKDALEYFRNLHPSKSIIFQQKEQRRCYQLWYY